jgi:hypothetical protein
MFKTFEQGRPEPYIYIVYLVTSLPNIPYTHHIYGSYIWFGPTQRLNDACIGPFTSRSLLLLMGLRGGRRARGNAGGAE